MELRVKSTQLSRERNLFMNKDFMLLFFGKLVSQLGDNIYNIAIAWFVLATTERALYMAAYLAIGKATYIIMSPFAGVLADKWDRKKIIYGMDFIRGLAVVALTILIYLEMPIEVILISLFIASIIVNLCSALFNPATKAIIPLIVRESQLTKANSMSMMVQSICSLLGAIIGGILYIKAGVYFVILLNGASYILSGFSELFITVPKKSSTYIADESKKKQAESETFKDQLTEGYRFLRKEKGLYIVTWFAFVLNFLGVPMFSVYLPYIFNQIIKSNPTDLAYVQSALGIGVLIGSMLLGLLPQKDKIYKLLRSCLMLQLIPMFFIGATLYLYQIDLISSTILLYSFLVSFGLIGVMMAMINIPLGVFTQRVVPNELLGRVGALTSTLVMAAMPLGMLIGGVLTDFIPMIVVLIIVFILYIITNTMFWVNKELRSI